MKSEQQVREYMKQWEETKADTPETQLLKLNIIAILKFILE